MNGPYLKPVEPRKNNFKNLQELIGIRKKRHGNSLQLALLNDN